MAGLVVADDWMARLPEPARAAIDAALVPERVAAGRPVAVEGTPADALFRVRAGYVKQTGIGEDGGITLLVVYAPGACFAETALIAGGMLNHTAVALTDVTVERLPADAFWRLYHAHPAIADALCRKFAGAIRRQVVDREERAALRARDRIARLFAHLATSAGAVEPDGRHRVDLALTHGDIAAHLHLTRQAVQREVAAFKQVGSVLRVGRGWLIDRGALTGRD